MNKEQTCETREIAIEAWNMLLGRAVFGYISVPATWVTGYQMDDPFITNRFLYKNLVWVGSGDIECLLSCERGEKKRPDLDFRVKLSVELKKNDPVAPSPDDLHDSHVEKGHQVLEQGTLVAGGHLGSYVLWTSPRSRLNILPWSRSIARIDGYVPCSETRRLLKFSWTSPSAEVILEHSQEIVASLNSVLCHGRDMPPPQEDGF